MISVSTSLKTMIAQKKGELDNVIEMHDTTERECNTLKAKWNRMQEEIDKLEDALTVVEEIEKKDKQP